MKKKLWSVILVTLSILVITSGAVAAANGEIRIPFIGGNVEMQVQSPFQASGWTGVTFKFVEGETTSLYPGQEIAKGELTISNISPLPLGIGFEPEPQTITGNWPAFDTIFTVGGKAYRSGEYIIPAGGKITGKVRISIAYWSQPSAPFQGLDLRIYPTAPQMQTEKG